jgi:hypothetical protein
VDAQIEVFDGATSLGTAAVDSALSEAPFDESGKATLPNTLPDDGRVHLLRVVGATTGTEIIVPVLADAPPPPTGKVASKVTLAKAPDKITTSTKNPRIKVTVTTANGPASGKVKVIVGGKTYSAALNDDGRVTVRIAQFKTAGKKTVRVKYLGNATTQPDTAKLTFFVWR